MNDTTDAQWHQQEQEERRAREASLAYWKTFGQSMSAEKVKQMDVSSYAESKSSFLKAADLKGHEVRVNIASVDEAEFDNGNKLVLKFAGKEKGLVLNITNLRKIVDRYGSETDNWSGKPVVLYEEKVEFGGNLVPAIRVRVPAPEATEDDIPW